MNSLSCQNTKLPYPWPWELRFKIYFAEAPVLYTHKREHLKQPLSSPEFEVNLALAQDRDFHSGFKLALTLLLNAVRGEAMLEARVRRKHKEECQTHHLENPKGRTKEGRTGCAADPGLTRASRRPGRHGGQAAGFLQSSWGSPGLLTGAKGVSRRTGHAALSATYFPWGTGWQRPSHSCQGYTFSFPGGTWSRLACRLFEYLSSVILRRCHSRRERAKLSSWWSWQLSVTCRFCDPPPARVSEGPLFSLDFLLLFV